jgi:hypothetical protein
MPNGPPMQQRARTVRICEIRMARVVAMVRIMAARLTVMVRVMVRVKGAKATKATKAARIAIPTNTLAFAWSNTRGNEVLFRGEYRRQMNPPTPGSSQRLEYC